MPSIWTLWAGSNCYPRRFLFKLSDDPPTGIAGSLVHCTCSTRRSHSQAPLCTFCTNTCLPTRLREPLSAFRYTFRRQPPQLNYPQALSQPDHGPRFRAHAITRVVFKDDSTATGVTASQSPTYPAQAIAGASHQAVVKVLGLSVLRGTSILLVLQFRRSLMVETAGEVVTPFAQVGTYPTRGICYLRMVIVTTAAYQLTTTSPRGGWAVFLTFQHRAGVVRTCTDLCF